MTKGSRRYNFVRQDITNPSKIIFQRIIKGDIENIFIMGKIL